MGRPAGLTITEPTRKLSAPITPGKDCLINDLLTGVGDNRVYLELDQPLRVDEP
jgi:hypothetical protein